MKKFVGILCILYFVAMSMLLAFFAPIAVMGHAWIDKSGIFVTKVTLLLPKFSVVANILQMMSSLVVVLMAIPVILALWTFWLKNEDEAEETREAEQ